MNNSLINKVIKKKQEQNKDLKEYKKTAKELKGFYVIKAGTEVDYSSFEHGLERNQSYYINPKKFALQSLGVVAEAEPDLFWPARWLHSIAKYDTSSLGMNTALYSLRPKDLLFSKKDAEQFIKNAPVPQLLKNGLEPASKHYKDFAYRLHEY